MSTTTTGLLLEHLRQEARNAYNNLSHRPDQRGDRLVQEYSDELTADLGTITGWAIDATRDRLEELSGRYRNEYISKLRSWLHATSRCASSFICGPANFPVARMQKRTASADNRYAEFRDWRTKALKGIQRVLQPKAPVDELAEAKARLAAREREQQRLKDGNKAIRAAKGDEAVATEKLRALGFSDQTIHDTLRPRFGKPGFPAWMLSNNNAEIRRLQDRVTVLEAKQAEGAAVGGERRVPFDRGEVIINYTADRVQIAHDAKPAPAVLTQLKQAAFKWSPSNMAWQRKITPFAIADAQRITGAVLIEPKPAPVLSLDDAMRQAVACLPAAWQKVSQPYPKEVEQRVMAALAGVLDEAETLEAAEELSAALPDPVMALQSGVPRHVVESLNAAIRAARETKAGENLRAETSTDDENEPEAGPEPLPEHHPVR